MAQYEYSKVKSLVDEGNLSKVKMAEKLGISRPTLDKWLIKYQRDNDLIRNMGNTGDIDFDLIGIGASAGGFEALREFISNIQEDSAVAYIITQHLDPSQPTMLLELLSKFTNLQILMIKDDMKIEPRYIYICPPNNNLTILNGKFRLSPPENKAVPKPSVNTFFISLAKAYEERAVGIIMSGTGSDGAEGIKAIKNAGGITIVQDERSAKYASMPRAAIDTGCVDIVLTPEQMAKELTSIIKAPNILKEIQSVSKGMDRIFDLLLEKFNVDFTDYKIGTVQRRLERRMAVNRVNNIEDYVKILLTSENEQILLYKDLLVVVTSFFRDLDLFEGLEESLDKMIDEHEQDTIRVWVAGCATGEEAYSIAMILREKLRAKQIRKGIQIFATDISEEAIAKARKALFAKEELEHISPSYIDNYFVSNEEVYEIKKDLRDHIIFSKHDVIKDPPFLNIDLVSCRNLLIYFNNDLQKRIMAIFHHALNRKGILFLGKSESVSNLSEAYTTISNKYKLYRKDSNVKDLALDQLTYYPKRYLNSIYAKTKHNDIKKEISNKDKSLKTAISNAMQDSLMKNYLIIDRNNNITFSAGDVSSYISFPKGSFSNDVFSFINPDIRLDLRVILSKARKDAVSFNQRVQIKDENSNLVKYINLMALPLEHDDYTNGSVALIFVDSSDEIDVTDKEQNTSSYYAKELETELLLTKEQLQTTIEELETSNEELQSTNEELQSTNEELQSTNEELETSNEELQSSNEELTTVNDELEMKSSELRHTNSDLQNIFNTIKIGTVIVNRSLMIQRFTKDIKEIFEINTSNINESITTIHSYVDIGNIRELIENIINNGKIKKFDIKKDNRYFNCTIYPYIDEYNKIDGAVLSFYDITNLKQKEKDILTVKDELRATLNSVDAIIVVAKDGKELVEANDNFFKFFRQFKTLEEFNKKHECIVELFEQIIKDNYFYMDDKKDISQKIKELNGKTVKVEIIKGDKRHIFSLKVGIFIGSHGIDKCVLSLNDITLSELKKEELELLIEKETALRIEKERILQQQSKLASMGEMIGNIAHQWRQPLSVISTAASGLKLKKSLDKLDDDTFIETIQQIVKSTQFLSDTIDIFRNFVKEKHTVMEVSLQDRIKHTLEIIYVTLKNNHIEFKTNIDEVEDVRIVMPIGELSQVLINIFNNATDVIVERKIEEPWIKLSLEKKNNKVIINIEDNAGGMDKDILPKVFDPYFTTKHQSQGTGLGLHMSYQIVKEVLKGEIYVKNTKNGAKFFIELPINSI